MTATLSLEPGRVHVHTPRFEWTILRRFDAKAKRGPCYVSDVRLRSKPYSRIAFERYGDARHTINDPELGGLFGFGVVVADPPPGACEAAVDESEFWSWGWEITSRLDAGGKVPSFGLAGVKVVPAVAAGMVTVDATGGFWVRGDLVMALRWRYRFGPGDRVACAFTAKPAIADLWIKEPKLVFAGWRDPKTLTVYDERGAQLGPVYDLTRLKDPARHTLQIAAPTRRRFVLEGDFRADVDVDRQISRWTSEADAAAPMSERFSPAYCLDGAGDLWDRFEVARRGDADRGVTGLYDHAWEGGYGAPDCWTCFRPWPSSTITTTASVELAS